MTVRLGPGRGCGLRASTGLVARQIVDLYDEQVAMSKIMISLICFFIFMGGLIGQAFPSPAADAPPPEGSVFPDIRLTIPQRPEDQQYLGLQGTGSFTVSNIQAEVVILEIFSMYCPFCQREAPNVKALFQMIDQNDDLKRKIKMIAVGAGNSLFEVNTYKNAYGMAFPHLPDTDFSIHNALGKVRTPYFVVLKLNKDGSNAVIYSKVGGIGDPRGFLEMITGQSGLTRGT